MTIPKVQHYNPKNNYPEFTIFVLCKGSNSGKPLIKPCPNCFAVMCRNVKNFDFYKSLLYGLWFSKAFHRIFTGSVIDFIRVGDFKKLLFEAAEKMEPERQALANEVKKANAFEKLEQNYLRRAALIAEMRRAIIHRYIKK